MFRDVFGYLGCFWNVSERFWDVFGTFETLGDVLGRFGLFFVMFGRFLGV